MKILVIGSNGQLGKDMVLECSKNNHDTIKLDFPDIDITSIESIEDRINRDVPDVIINCAAYTAVDDCEKNKEIAFKVNCDGVGNIAKVANSKGIKVAHIGTDYVFSGDSNIPYIESDEPNPRSVYGQSKLAGEKLLSEILPQHWIFRIAWLYGTNGKNFVKTIRRIALDRSNSNSSLRVVNDQFGTPTYTVNVCKQILKVIETDNYGVFHCTNQGQCSWFDFTKKILDIENIDVDLQPCSSSEYLTPAPRPAFSVLENYRLKELNLDIMPKWEDGFSDFIAEEKSKL